MTVVLSHPPRASADALLFADILCGIDGTRSADEAVCQAASLAAPDGRLTLLAVTGRRGTGTQRSAVLGAERARRALARAERLAAATGVACAAALEDRAPVTDVLLELAGTHRLLAIGPPPMPRIAHLLVGGTATTAAHLLPVSVLVARRAPSRHAFGRRILVASDGLEHSDELVDVAVSLAERRAAALTLLHVTSGSSTALLERFADQVDRASDALDDSSAVRVEPGRAHHVVAGVARDERCSLVIVGSRRLCGLRALGSVSERVVHNAPCSVLVLRPEDLTAVA